MCILVAFCFVSLLFDVDAVYGVCLISLPCYHPFCVNMLLLKFVWGQRSIVGGLGGLGRVLCLLWVRAQCVVC